MAYTAEIVYRDAKMIAEGQFLITITLEVKSDGVNVFTTSVSATTAPSDTDKAAIIKQKLESKLIQAWDAFLVENAVAHSQQAFDTLCDTIVSDVETYLNQ